MLPLSLKIVALAIKGILLSNACFPKLWTLANWALGTSIPNFSEQGLISFCSEPTQSSLASSYNPKKSRSDRLIRFFVSSHQEVILSRRLETPRSFSIYDSESVANWVGIAVSNVGIFVFSSLVCFTLAARSHLACFKSPHRAFSYRIVSCWASQLVWHDLSTSPFPKRFCASLCKKPFHIASRLLAVTDAAACRCGAFYTEADTRHNTARCNAPSPTRNRQMIAACLKAHAR